MAALDDGPAVERQDVALLEAVVAGDAVDDDLVGRRADHSRESVVVEEVRAGVAPLQHLAGDPVEFGRRGPRLGGGDALLVHLGHHPAGAAHLGQLVCASTHWAVASDGSRWRG